LALFRPVCNGPGSVFLKYLNYFLFKITFFIFNCFDILILKNKKILFKYILKQKKHFKKQTNITISKIFLKIFKNMIELVSQDVFLS
jgi:hypothetical protein